MKPISPSEVADAKLRTFPDEVIAAFNELIAAHYVNGEATVRQDDAVQLIVQKLGVSSTEVYDRGWLNVESLYRAAGWTVTYDKPGYNESYPATYTFRRKKA